MLRRLRSLAVAVLVLAGAFVVSAIVRINQENQVDTVVDTYARVFTTKLEERLQSRFLVAELIAGELAMSDRFQDSMFLSAAQTIHGQLDDLRALNWVGPDGVIDIVTPAQGNQAALGLDVMSLAAPGQTLRAAAARDALQVTPPITLAQGGLGFVAYLPVRNGGTLFGFVNLVFEAAPLVASAMSPESGKSFHVAIYDGAEPIHVQEMGSHAMKHAAVNRISVGGRTWSVTVAPTDLEIARTESILDEGMLLIGLLIAIAAAYLVNESSFSKATLRDREERFALAMKGASDGLFDWNTATGETYFSPRWYEILGYREGQLPSTFDTFTSMMHPDDVSRVIQTPQDLFSSDNDHIENEFRMRHRDGSWKTILSRAFVVRKAGRVVRVVGTHIDITNRIERQRALEHAAKTDDLTGLQNRRGLHASLSALTGSLSARECLAVLHLDLDEFKAINDTSGHEAGDAALVATADRLRSFPGGFDFIARVGGDEFLLARKLSGAPEQIAPIAQDLIAAVSTPFTLNGNQHRVGASIGISFLGEPDVDSINLAISNSDIALNEAKSLGRGRYVFFEDAMREAAIRSAERLGEIETALERGEFRAFFQPQIDMRSGALCGFEALARWAHPSRGLLPASEFIPMAEQAHLVEAIDDRILQEACQALHAASRAGADDISISVNLSSAQLNDPMLVDRVTRISQEAQVSPGRLRIEILETTLLTDRTATVAKNIRRLAEAGFPLELDDFGSGHAAIASLRDYPISRIKIARNLIADIANDPQLQAIARAIIDLCSTLEIEVLAEGIESAEDMAFLATTACGYAQGYHIGHPMAPDKLEKWVSGRRPARTDVSPGRLTA